MMSDCNNTTGSFNYYKKPSMLFLENKLQNEEQCQWNSKLLRLNGTYHIAAEMPIDSKHSLDNGETSGPEVCSWWPSVETQCVQGVTFLHCQFCEAIKITTCNRFTEAFQPLLSNLFSGKVKHVARVDGGTHAIRRTNGFRLSARLNFQIKEALAYYANKNTEFRPVWMRKQLLGTAWRTLVSSSPLNEAAEHASAGGSWASAC